VGHQREEIEMLRYVVEAEEGSGLEGVRAVRFILDEIHPETPQRVGSCSPRKARRYSNCMGLAIK